MAKDRPEATVSRFLLQAAIVPAALALVVAAVLAIEVSSLVESSRWVQHTDEVIGAAHEMQGMLVDRESGLRGYVLTHDRTFLAPYDSATNAISARWETLARSVSDNADQLGRLREMRALSEQWDAYAGEILAADVTSARSLVGAGRGRQIMDDLRARIQSFIQVEEGLRDQRSRSEQAAAHRTVLVSGALIIAVAVLLALAARRQVRDLARRFGAALDSAKQAEKLRDEFLTVAAHELRTPLTALLLQLQRLRRDLDRGTAVQSSAQIDTPLRQARRLSALIESLLDAQAVASGGPVELKYSACNMATIAESALSRVRDGLVQLGCHVDVKLDVDVDGEWDAPRIEHIIATLVANGCKYGEGRPVRLEARRDGEMRVLVVSDEGIGIPTDLQDRIFGRFGRAAPTRSYGGFGLSLFVARRLAEAHGGTLTVVSERGKGATFTLRLPRVGAREVELEARQAG